MCYILFNQPGYHVLFLKPHVSGSKTNNEKEQYENIFTESTTRPIQSKSRKDHHKLPYVA